MNEKLTPKQTEVLNYVIKHGPVQATEIKTETSCKNPSEALRTLTEYGIVQRIAPSPKAKRNVYWRAARGTELDVVEKEEPVEPVLIAGVDFPLITLEIFSDHARVSNKDAARLLLNIGSA